MNKLNKKINKHINKFVIIFQYKNDRNIITLFILWNYILRFFYTSKTNLIMATMIRQIFYECKVKIRCNERKKKKKRKEGRIVLFNDTLNTFYL